MRVTRGFVVELGTVIAKGREKPLTIRDPQTRERPKTGNVALSHLRCHFIPLSSHGGALLRLAPAYL